MPNIGEVKSWGDLAAERIADSPASREAWEFYWRTDISTTEIMKAFGLRTLRQLLELAGPAVLANIQCVRCHGHIEALSRSELRARVDRLSTPTRGHQFIQAAWGDICRECAIELKAEQLQVFKVADAARDARRNALRSMPYRDYLQTPEWKETRAAAIKRARGKCQTCSGGGVLHVHHRTYVRRGAEYASDLIVLCAGCHKLFHDTSKLAEGGRAE